MKGVWTRNTAIVHYTMHSHKKQRTFIIHWIQWAACRTWRGCEHATQRLFITQCIHTRCNEERLSSLGFNGQSVGHEGGVNTSYLIQQWRRSSRIKGDEGVLKRVSVHYTMHSHKMQLTFIIHRTQWAVCRTWRGCEHVFLIQPRSS